MKKITAILIFTYGWLFAQAPDTMWTKTYGGADNEVGHSVQQTTDGGYIITGQTASFGAGGDDVWLIETDAAGDTMWTKTYGGAGHESGRSVQQTTDGGYILTGFTTSWGAGEKDIWLIKTDAAGDTMWTKTYGGADNEGSQSVQLTSDGGYIIAGWTHSYGAGYYDVWLIKTDASGNTLWTKTYGGTGFDAGFFVVQTSDSGYILTGHTSSYGAGGSDIRLIRTNDSGDTIWTKVFGDTLYDVGWCVQQTTDDGYILTGVWDLSQGYSSDIFLIKIAPESGTVIETENTTRPTNFVLKQNYPNPFNPSTTIEFGVPKTVNVRIEIFNIAGQKLKSLLNRKMQAGNYEVKFNADELASGLYFYRIEAGEFSDVKKMVLLH